MDDDAVHLFIAEMISAGALEVEEIDGEWIYRHTALTQILYPEYYQACQEELDEELLYLLQLGLIDVTYDENLEAVFSLTEAGKQYAEEQNGTRDNSDPDPGGRG